MISFWVLGEWIILSIWVMDLVLSGLSLEPYNYLNYLHMIVYTNDI